MGKIKYISWILVILFIWFAKDYTNRIQYPENIMYFYEELPVGQQEIRIYSDDQPIGYHEITKYYEDFPTIYKNDFNQNYRFVLDKKNNNTLTMFRVVRLITTFN